MLTINIPHVVDPGSISKMDTFDLPPFEPTLTSAEDRTKRKQSSTGYSYSVHAEPPVSRDDNASQQIEPTMPWFTTNAASTSTEAIFGFNSGSADYGIFDSQQSEHQLMGKSSSVQNIQSMLPPWEENSEKQCPIEEPEAVMRALGSGSRKPSYQTESLSYEHKSAIHQHEPEQPVFYGAGSNSIQSKSPAISPQSSFTESKTAMPYPSVPPQQPLSPLNKFCTRCGHKNGADCNFCGNCGLQLIKSPSFPDISEVSLLSNELSTMGLATPKIASISQSTDNLNLPGTARTVEKQERVHPVVSFGFGGQIVYSIPKKQSRYSSSTRATVDSYKPGLMHVESCESRDLGYKNIPLGPYDEKIKPRDISKAIGTIQAADEIEAIILQVLGNALDANGKIWCQKNVELLKNYASSTGPEFDNHAESIEQYDDKKAMELLKEGNISGALDAFISTGSFASAFALSRYAHAGSFDTVLSQYVSNLSANNPLRVIMCLHGELPIDDAMDWRNALYMLCNLKPDMCTALGKIAVRQESPMVSSLLNILSLNRKPVIHPHDISKSAILTEIYEYCLNLSGQLKEGVISGQLKLHLATMCSDDPALHSTAIAYCRQIQKVADPNLKRQIDVFQDRLEHSSNYNSMKSAMEQKKQSSSMWDKFNLADAIMSSVIGEDQREVKQDAVEKRPMFQEAPTNQHTNMSHPQPLSSSPIINKPTFNPYSSPAAAVPPQPQTYSPSKITSSPSQPSSEAGYGNSYYSGSYGYTSNINEGSSSAHERPSPAINERPSIQESYGSYGHNNASDSQAASMSSTADHHQPSYQPANYYQQPQSPSSGYQNPASSGYSQPASSGYQQSPSSGYQQPTASGYQQSTASSYQQSAASGYQQSKSPAQPAPSGYQQQKLSPTSGYPQYQQPQSYTDDLGFGNESLLKKDAQSSQGQHPSESQTPTKKTGGVMSMFKNLLSSSASASATSPPPSSTPSAVSSGKANLGEQLQLKYDEKLGKWVDNGAALDSQTVAVPSLPPKLSNSALEASQYKDIKKHFDPFNLSSGNSSNNPGGNLNNFNTLNTSYPLNTSSTPNTANAQDYNTNQSYNNANQGHNTTNQGQSGRDLF